MADEGEYSMEREKLRILYIGGRVFPTPTANAINSINVIEELLNNGHSVTYIAVNQDEKNPDKLLGKVDVYSIRNTKYGSLLNKSKEAGLGRSERLNLLYYSFLRKIMNTLNVLKFPDVEPRQSKEIFKLANELHNNISFDAIIGVFRPFSSISSVIMMKDKYPDLVGTAYYLDLLTGSNKPFLMPKFLYKNLSKYGEIKKLSKLDLILMPIKGKSIYSKKDNQSLTKKIRYVDFPVFKIFNKLSNDYSFNAKNRINFVFAGTLNKEYRSPELTLKILESLSSHITNFTLHIFGRGNCDSIINKYTNKLNIEMHGMVPHDEILNSLNNADFLINISNKMENMVPSKIFELFSTGKPIINFVSNKNDAAFEYFAKYPSVCSINAWNNFDDNLKLLVNFISSEKDKKYDVLKIREHFIENTPEYTARILEENIVSLISNNIRRK